MEPLIKKIPGNKRKGIKLLIISGAHGNELTPIHAAMKLTEIRMFMGVRHVTVMLGVNMSGLKSHTREMTSSNTMDLNRVLSNEPTVDSIELLKEQIESHDMIIDIHSSPSCTEFALIDIDEYAHSMKKWCDLANLKCAFRYSSSNTIKRYCLEKGKPALTLEVNKLDMIDYKSSKRCVDILAKLVSLANLVSINEEPPTFPEIQEIKTYKEGLLSFHLNNGDEIKIGTSLFNIVDLNGTLIHTEISQVEGYVVCEPSQQYVNRGEYVMLVQPKY